MVGKREMLELMLSLHPRLRARTMSRCFSRLSHDCIESYTLASNQNRHPERGDKSALDHEFALNATERFLSLLVDKAWQKTENKQTPQPKYRATIWNVSNSLATTVYLSKTHLVITSSSR